MPRRAPLTERQNQVLEFIRSFLYRHRKPPTLQEIGEALGIRSTNGVSKLLAVLQQKGYLKREPRAARSLRLVDADLDPFSTGAAGLPNLPLISRTASDQPERLRETPRRYLTIDPSLLGRAREDECLLVVAGDDGMNGDGIHKGDVLIIEEQPWDKLRREEIAAVLVGEEVRARRFVFTNDRIHLSPSDRHYAEEMYLPNDPGCYVIGRVVGVLRKL